MRANSSIISDLNVLDMIYVISKISHHMTIQTKYWTRQMINNHFVEHDVNIKLTIDYSISLTHKTRTEV